MRDYGKVYSSFWTSVDIRSMSEDERTAAIYLLTCPHANLIGCYRLSLAYAADDLQWGIERVTEVFAKLSERHFITRDNPSGWVFIHQYLKWNQFENPNVATSARKAFEQVPDVPFKYLIAKAILEYGAHLKEDDKAALTKASQTLREAFVIPEPEPEPLPEPLPEPEPLPGNTGGYSVCVERDKRASQKIATRLGSDWELPKSWGEWALKEYPGWTPAVVRSVAANFADHWHSEPGKDGVKLDWLATWRKWCRNDITQRSHSGHVNGKEKLSVYEQSIENGKEAKRMIFGDGAEHVSK